MPRTKRFTVTGMPGRYRLVSTATGDETPMDPTLTKEQADRIASEIDRTMEYCDEGGRLAAALDAAIQSGDRAKYNELKASIADWHQREP